MNSAPINSILARCLLDVGFLDRISCDPITVLQAYDLDDRTWTDFLRLDVNRVRYFAGFITKVQHNYLWESFPYTRALLKLYQIEIEVFTAYLAIYQQLRAQGAISKDQKIESFMKFLLAYLEPSKKVELPGLQEVIAHEHMEWEIRRALRGVESPGPQRSQIDLSALSTRQLGRLVPVVQGAFRVNDFIRDPLVIVKQIAQGSFDPQEIPEQRQYLGYWGETATNQLHILELDDLSANLLSLVNGRRSIRVIIERVAKTMPYPIYPSELRPFFQALFNQGFLMAGLRGAMSASER